MADDDWDLGGADVADPEATGRPRGAKTTLLLGLLIVGAFVVGMAAVTILSSGQEQPQAGTAAVPNPLEDRIAPTEQAPLPLVTLAGFGPGEPEPVDLAEYVGAPLIVNFWASWCAPCVSEMPDLQEYSETEQIPLLGVNVQDAPANAQAFVTELGITYDLASDPAGELYTSVRGFGMPTTLLVDESGTIVYRHTGPLDVGELRNLAAEHF